MPTSYRNEQSPVSAFVLGKTWVNTPKYRQLVAQKKILPENPFTWSQTEVHSEYSLVQPYRSLPNFTEMHGPLFDWGTSFFFEIGSRLGTGGQEEWVLPQYALAGDRNRTRVFLQNRMETLAGNRLSKKLNSRDIDLGVALGEARETAHFIQSAMLATYAAGKRARKGDVSGVLKALGFSKTPDLLRQRLRDVPDAAAKAQLTLSYAVRPLLADVLGACQALEKRHESADIVTVRASEYQPIDIQLETTYVRKFGGSGPLKHDAVWKVEGWQRASEKLTFQVNNPLLYKLSTLGLTNPLSVAWELVTLSFVVDWFIPIGSWINGLVPPQGVTNVRRSTTWKGDVGIQLEEHFGGGSVVRSRGSSKWKNRSVKTDLPRYHLVGASFDLSKQQVMSGLSLLWAFGASEKSQAKAYNDAVALNSRGYQNISSKSKEAWGMGGRSKLQLPKYPFPPDYSKI